MSLIVQAVKPSPSHSFFVDSFWMLHNASADDKKVIVLPDGKIDLFFSRSATEPFHVTLMGLGTQPEQATIVAQTVIFAVSFNLPATEYILHQPVAHLTNNVTVLPADFWDFCAADLNEFDSFCKKAAQKIHTLLPTEIDSRKQLLFESLYAANGAITVKSLSEKVFWSSRQMNRYFNQQYGISLKAYCDILRFRASFHHISEGKLFPEQNFADQSHFIKAVKKLAGVSPRELSRNQNDRFVQFSTLPPK
ncbi:transcriptional regulator [Niastella vici]|uniref:Transcriptional regulator n=1 Tax=Niastella vici TaxID=1703345 RepID=A0A1V9FYT1_9BACT|nr:AraC family transcriptional regulator [Niastella vici]OQP63480.1 transcriptional regulator [Niastella vici]